MTGKHRGKGSDPYREARNARDAAEKRVRKQDRRTRCEVRRDSVARLPWGSYLLIFGVVVAIGVATMAALGMLG